MKLKLVTWTMVASLMACASFGATTNRVGDYPRIRLNPADAETTFLVVTGANKDLRNLYLTNVLELITNTANAAAESAASAAADAAYSNAVAVTTNAVNSLAPPTFGRLLFYHTFAGKADQAGNTTLTADTGQTMEVRKWGTYDSIYTCTNWAIVDGWARATYPGITTDEAVYFSVFLTNLGPNEAVVMGARTRWTLQHDPDELDGISKRKDNFAMLNGRMYVPSLLSAYTVQANVWGTAESDVLDLDYFYSGGTEDLLPSTQHPRWEAVSNTNNTDGVVTEMGFNGQSEVWVNRVGEVNRVTSTYIDSAPRTNFLWQIHRHTNQTHWLEIREMWVYAVPQPPAQYGVGITNASGVTALAFTASAGTKLKTNDNVLDISLAATGQSESLAIPTDAFVYETFNRTNGLMNGSITSDSGHPIFFSVATTYDVNATNLVIDDGLLKITGTNASGGYNTYMWFTVPGDGRFVTGIRARSRLWNAASTYAYSAGVTFACGRNPKDTFWNNGDALHSQLSYGNYGMYWSSAEYTNGVNGGQYYLNAVRPLESTSMQTNTWRIFEYGCDGPNSYWLAVDGIRTNICLTGNKSTSDRTNCYWQFGGSAAKSISDGLFNEWEIDSFWVRKGNSGTHADLRSIAVSVRTNATSGSYTCSWDEVFYVNHSASNIYLPGGLSVRTPGNVYSTPFQNRLMVIVDQTLFAEGTNIHIRPALYTNWSYVSGSVAETNVYQDNINGVTTPYLLGTNRGAVRLLCTGTNWVTW